jgi:hypothetical protein
MRTLFATALLCSSLALAQDLPRYGIAFGAGGAGYEASAQVRLQRRYTFAAGAYGTDVFGEKGDVGVRQGYFLSASHLLGSGHGCGCGGATARPGGLFIGVRLGAGELRVPATAEPAVEPGSQLQTLQSGVDAGGSSTLHPWAISAMPHLGYLWFPLKQETFFVRPWVGASFTFLSGEAGGYRPRLFTPMGGAQFGFEFH